MNRFIACVVFIALAQAIMLAQGRGVQIEGKEVAQNEDVVFRQIDEHTWIGTAHVMANESLYLLEGQPGTLDRRRHAHCRSGQGRRLHHQEAGHARRDARSSGSHRFGHQLFSGVEHNPGDAGSSFLAMMGLNLIVTAFGVRISYSEKSLQ